MNTKRVENISIATIWGIILVLPLFQYLLTTEDERFGWHEMGVTYVHAAAFFVLFALHHYLISPLLFARKRYWLYTAVTVVTLSGFVLFMKNAPFGPPRGRHMAEQGMRHDVPNDRHRYLKPKECLFMSPHERSLLIIALLMLWVDIGFNAIIKTQKQRRRLIELEQQNLRQELQYLKYQINPHFFMNTLNNIHVLIDVDQEKAKRSLVELSRLMRYMLYEGNGSFVLLSQEIEYISQYLSLMKLRYSDKVEITCQMPETQNGILVPPLLFITFIENAFKHGVSYQQQSFIHITLQVDESSKGVRFECSNSRVLTKQKDDCGGIGLENVRKRLDLIYDKDYRLEVCDDDPKLYRVILELTQIVH